jgi:hypothetical protein
MFETGDNTQERAVQKYYGKYPGLVLDNAPPSGSDHRGEVLVEVPGILEDDPGGKDQRPIQVVARPCFLPGFFFIPEKGAQVWVEFAAGDINTPIWTGVWYPKDKPPKTVDSKAPTLSQKVIRTVSGQVIQLDDSNGKEEIVIKDEKNDNTITLDANGITIKSAGKTISITCKKMEIKGDVDIDGKVHVTGDTNIDAILTVGTGPKTTIKSNEITGG